MLAFHLHPPIPPPSTSTPLHHHHPGIHTCSPPSSVLSTPLWHAQPINYGMKVQGTVKFHLETTIIRTHTLLVLFLHFIFYIFFLYTCIYYKLFFLLKCSVTQVVYILPFYFKSSTSRIYYILIKKIFC